MGPGLPLLWPLGAHGDCHSAGPACTFPDTGAEHSVLQTPLGSASNKKVAVQGATGAIEEYPVTHS